MGTKPFRAVVTYHHSAPKTRIDFAALDPAVDFGRDRAFDPAVAHVEIHCGEAVIWRAADLEQWREEVSAETDTA